MGISWSSWRIRPLEWRIAWRHLRAGETAPSWVRWLFMAAAFLLVVGAGFALYAAYGLAPETPQLVLDPTFPVPTISPEQSAFGTIGGVTIFAGYMLLVFALLARFFNLLATIITFSVLLGCMALVIVLSLMSGLEGVLRDQILNQRAHMLVSRDDSNRFADYADVVEALSATEGVAGASPYLEGEVMVRSGLNRQGALLIGVIPERLVSVSNIDEIVKEGRYDSLLHPEDIPEVDPLSFRREETPWRLRHLDDEKGGNSLRPRRGLAPKKASPEPGEEGEPVGVVGDPELLELPPPPSPGEGGREGPEPGPPPGEDDDVDPGGELLPGLGGSLGLPGVGPARALGPPSEEDDGWEDPVEELELGEGKGPPAPAVPSGEGEGEGEDEAQAEDGDEGGWEDPSEELGLEPLSPEEEAPEPGPDAGDGDSDGPTVTLGEGAVLTPILIGRELAMELAVHVGANIQLITPVGRMTPAGRVPGTLSTRVGAVFFSGMYEYDRKNVYAPLPKVQAFLHSGDRVTGIEIKLADVQQLQQGKAAVEGVLSELGRSELRVQTWQELNRNLFSAMFLEKIAMFVALLFVVLVASFGILASNLMSVLEKAKEIAILKAMGSTDLSIQRVFVAEGLCVGILGAVSGIAIGLAMCWALDNYGLPLNENVYYMEQLPVVVNPVEVALVGIAALVIVWFSSLYPARVASRMRPVEGLRHSE